ncbi:hypothetical protein PSYPI_11804, partial [Pseudomonas syringae pv. pisi str. 1704B]
GNDAVAIGQDHGEIHRTVKDCTLACLAADGCGSKGIRCGFYAGFFKHSAQVHDLRFKLFSCQVFQSASRSHVMFGMGGHLPVACFAR